MGSVSGACRWAPRTWWRGRCTRGPKAAVRIVKRIPAGAGLGGGSADAAAVLRWARCDDVVLAVAPRCRRPVLRARRTGPCHGRGGDVAPLPFEDRRFVLVAATLGRRDRRRLPAVGRPSYPTGRGRASDDEALGNDLEAAAIDVAPRLARWRDRLGEMTGAASPRRQRLDVVRRGRAARLGLAGRDFLALEGSAPLVAVRTVRALPR